MSKGNNYKQIYQFLLPDFDNKLSEKQQNLLINDLIKYRSFAQIYESRLSSKYQGIDSLPILANILINLHLSKLKNSSFILENFNPLGGSNINRMQFNYLKRYYLEKLFNIKTDDVKLKKDNVLKGKSSKSLVKKPVVQYSYKNTLKTKYQKVDLTSLLNQEYTEHKDDNEVSNENVPEEDVKLNTTSYPSIPIKDIFDISEILDFDDDLKFLLLNTYLILSKFFNCKKKLLCGLCTFISKEYFKELIKINKNFDLLINKKITTLFSCDLEDMKLYHELVLPYLQKSFVVDEISLQREFLNEQIFSQYDDYKKLKKPSNNNQWLDDILLKINK
ncbi:uncharacterized protein HGUI_03325 [Hanseniaspora guilliermondii]|uniref:Uncharacterized protein n=1 Tax=Hanseniaspora guilliermondii TaxID=56406 RepID=A0A1L0CQ51_9ASCO|nr:uncharacterized protein HGUI_03325 [Hanseniaspora guilliermondii]